MRTLGRSSIVAILAAMLIAGSVLAGAKKSGSISGCLTYSDTGLPLEGARVELIETGVWVITDSAGCFTFEQVAPGLYNLMVTHHEGGTFEGLDALRVSVKSGRAANVSVGLELRQAKEREEAAASDEVDYAEIKKVFGSYPAFEPNSTGRNKALGIVRTPTGQSGSLNQSQRPRRPRPPVYEYDYPWDPESPHDMYFRDFGTSGFVDTRRDRRSTFAVDVDDASYTLARQYLWDGNRPPAEAIRIEEFINHFDYGYNYPDGNDIFRVFSEIDRSPFDPNRQLLKIAVKGQEAGRWERKPMNITFVIDKSGSMREGNRFQLVRESVMKLARQLGRSDRVGIVAYGSQAFVALDPVPATAHAKIKHAMNRIQPGGSTYAEAGIRLGYDIANSQFTPGHNNVVILCSDGVANVGRTSPDAIMRQIAEWAKQGISLNAYGYGMGNYNDALLEQLAQKGDGRYGYINDSREVGEVFGGDFMSNLQVLARDVKIQVEFNPKLVASYRLIGYENRDVPDHKFRDNSQDGGEIFAGHEVTALYELVMTRRQPRGRVAEVFVRWHDADGEQVSELRQPIKNDRRHQRRDGMIPQLRLAAVAARFAEMLKETRFSAGTSWEELYHEAQPLARQLPGEQTSELLDLIQKAGNLDDWQARHDHDYRFSRNYKR